MPDTENNEVYFDMFEEPVDFRPPPPQGTTVIYNQHLPPHTELKINLIGSSPLYGHILTHACLYLAKFLETHAERIVKNKRVLEVGAGGALPSILCGKLGAKCVVCTDYPDPELIDNIKLNIEVNGVSDTCVAEGYIWGSENELLAEELQNRLGSSEKESFDLIILSDVIFNHSEHKKLIGCCKYLIASNKDIVDKQNGPQILVPFSPHRPHLLKEDLDFFKLAEEEFGFDVEFVTMEMWSPLFKNDTDESTREIRSRVYSYILRPTW